MKILAFAASNSRNSINRALVDHAAASILPGILHDATVELLDLNDYEMPIYSIDREREFGIPAEAREFFGRIGAADALLVSFAEHNGFVTAAWKNVFDWMSRIETKVWQGKPMVILAASPGSRAGARVLASQVSSAPRFGGEVRSSFGIGEWSKAWDAGAKVLTRHKDVTALSDALAALAPQQI